MSEKPSLSADTKYAWQTVPRRSAPKRSAPERLADFLEIYGSYDEATAREQASRCIQCPEPQCVEGCPLGHRIPEWLALTAEGHFLEAASLLRTTANMTDICARVCAADRLCEGMCVLNGRAEPVSILAIEQFLNEYAFAHGALEDEVAPPNGRRVAVLGAGPGGLACADELTRRGYAVTLYDSRRYPGGLLVDGVPTFKLEKSLVQRRIDVLRRRGVVFELGVRVGTDITLHEVRRRHDAVCVALGARQARVLDTPGADLPEVVSAASFVLPPDPEAGSAPSVDVAGKRVTVLGGGDMAMDCLRVALRCGAREVTGVYRRDETSLRCSRREYESATEEGARFVFQAAAVEVLANPQGHVAGLRLRKTVAGAEEADGRRAFTPQPGTEFDLPTDYVIVALGFEPRPVVTDLALEALNPEEWSGVRVDDSMMTTLAGVFAGGEVVRGPSSILETVRDGRRAAAGIDHYLRSAIDAAYH